MARICVELKYAVIDILCRLPRVVTRITNLLSDKAFNRQQKDCLDHQCMKLGQTWHANPNRDERWL